MPLSPPASREPIHRRTILCRGFLRADGLWDIEAHLRDEKAYAFVSEGRGRLEPGDPVHDMSIRVTIDEAMMIRAIEVASDATPFRPCASVVPNFQRLVGLRLGRGFRAKLAALVGGTEGCTHLIELFGPIATTAFQAIFPWKHRNEPTGHPAEPVMLDACRGFARHGEVVRRLWPDHARD
jgi:hypothetical protein